MSKQGHLGVVLKNIGQLLVSSPNRRATLVLRFVYCRHIFFEPLPKAATSFMDKHLVASLPHEIQVKELKRRD